MPKILALTRYDRLGASSRVRFLQFLPSLIRSGITVDVQPFLDDAYIRALYAGRSVGSVQILRHYHRRKQVLARRGNYDLIWMEKEALPWLPTWVESPMMSGVPYVVDLDDAWFHRYDRNRIAPVRWLMGDKIDVVMRSAAAVVVGNAYLNERATRAGARRIELIPSVIDLGRYALAPSAPASTSDRPIVIGWIGTPLNAHYLTPLEPALRAIAAARPVKLHVVGAPVPLAMKGLPAESRAWSEAREIDEIEQFDIGIMPLKDTPWERGKCAYKLLQVMAAGKPVVASPVGANCDVVRPAVNGFLVDSPDEWATALNSLAADPALRMRMGAAARRTVEDRYSLARAAARLAAVLTEAASRGRR